MPDMSPQPSPATTALRAAVPGRRYILVPDPKTAPDAPDLRRLRLARVDGEPPPQRADAPFDYLKRTYD